MISLQPGSLKIQKRPRIDCSLEKNFVCGACSRGYGCISALNLHIRKKHNGQTPPNTKIIKSPRPQLENTKVSGRPIKCSRDIDNLCERDANLQRAEDELAKVFGEKLCVVSSFGPKPTIEVIGTQISNLCRDGKDKWFRDVQDESARFLNDYEYKDSKTIHLDFSEEFEQIDLKKKLRVIVWIIIWLTQVYIQPEYIENLCFIFSKMWKVLEEIDLNIQDLDNKLVWKKITEECAGSMDKLELVKKDPALLFIFVQKICELIGKAAEEKDFLGGI